MHGGVASVVSVLLAEEEGGEGRGNGGTGEREGEGRVGRVGVEGGRGQRAETSINLPHPHVSQLNHHVTESMEPLNGGAPRP